METNVNELLDKLSEHIKSMASTETIIGEEFTLGNQICKPVIKIGMGFGSAGGNGSDCKGKGQGNGSAAGAGIGIAPVGFLVGKGDDVEFISTEKPGGLSALIEKVPDIMEKIVDYKKQEDAKEEKKDKK